VAGDHYYASPDGELYKATTVMIDGVMYSFDYYGVCLNPN